MSENLKKLGAAANKSDLLNLLKMICFPVKSPTGNKITVYQDNIETQELKLQNIPSVFSFPLYHGGILMIR